MITEEAASMYYFATEHMVSEHTVLLQSILLLCRAIVLYASFGAELHNTCIQKLMSWTLFSSAKNLRYT